MWSERTTPHLVSVLSLHESTRGRCYRSDFPLRRSRASASAVTSPSMPSRSQEEQHYVRDIDQQERTGATAGSYSPRPPDGLSTLPTSPAVRSLLNRAGLRRIRFHDLRHSTATLLLEQGIDLVVIKELLGHAHIGVTAGVYAHVRLRLQRQAIDTLSNALSPTGNDPDDLPATVVVR